MHIVYVYTYFISCLKRKTPDWPQKPVALLPAVGVVEFSSRRPILHKDDGQPLLVLSTKVVLSLASKVIFPCRYRYAF